MPQLTKVSATGPDRSLARGPDRSLHKGPDPNLVKGPAPLTELETYNMLKGGQTTDMIMTEGLSGGQTVLSVEELPTNYSVCNTVMQAFCMRTAETNL